MALIPLAMRGEYSTAANAVSRIAAIAAMAIVAGLATPAVLAQSPAAAYPSKPVRLVIPVPAGGLQDTLARAIAQELSKTWGQSVIVDNRVGANGIIAWEIVGRAAADGHTILQTDNVSTMTNHFLRSNLTYDAFRDFTPVIALIQSGNILVTGPEFAAKTLQELIALAQAKPGELTYGSFGLGSSPHVDTEAFSALAGIRLTHIPYKGGVPILQALMGGQIAFSLTGITAAIPLIRQGRLKAIAYGGLRRSQVFPEVPTFAESGFPGFESGAWFGWFAPAATPAGTLDRIAADAGRVIVAQEFREKYILGGGHEILNLPPAAFAELVKADRDKYGMRLKALNIKLE